MTLEQALLKIISLQDEVAKLKEQLHKANSRVSLTNLINPSKHEPWIVKNSCQHEYPNPWFGVTPPSCKKCDLMSEMLTVTCTDGSGVLKINGQ